MMYRGFHLYTGQWGDGKTYSAVEAALERLANGCHVYSNIELLEAGCRAYCQVEYGCDIEFDKLVHPLSESDCLDLVKHVNPGPIDHPSLVILDEGASFFDNRDFQSTKEKQPAIYDFFRQSRKLDLDVIMTTADVGDIDKKLRVKCHSIYTFFNMQRIQLGFLKYPIPQILAQEFFPHNPPPRGHANRKSFKVRDRLIFNCYRTKQILRAIPGLEAQRDVWHRPKRSKVLSRSLLSWFRPSYALFLGLILIPFLISCSNKERAALKSDRVEVSKMRQDLAAIFDGLKNSPDGRVSSTAQSVLKDSGSVSNNTLGCETIDGAVIASGYAINRQGMSCLLLPNGRILQIGSRFGSFLVIGLQPTAINAIDMTTKRTVSIPTAGFF